ncbi:MAG: NAD(P)(+) transhydrogenase (Re/Si-specific) subunit alpha, partial [Desulfobacterales bacterium]|nr:NAD(P)(+) transhydrogenase (Re/Si-specific) subunit alpha [Desulfobacterales bacterium]
MKVAITTETYPGEKRVALVPASVPLLVKLGLDVHIQSGAGLKAGFTDEQYSQKGATVTADRTALLADADIVCQVRAYGANPDRGADDLSLCKPGAIIIGHADPLLAHSQNQATAEAGHTLLAMELVPRITRAQAMDALSSQANLAGYKAVLMAADASGKIMPMMMTAAGTLKPAKAFIVGAGVAGLQAIATAKRLGAIVSAIDVRPEVKEQIESLGAKFVEPPEAASGEGGYAKEQTEEQKQKQQELMADTVAESDIVIT